VESLLTVASADTDTSTDTKQDLGQSDEQQVARLQ
jgi:hypothetical protein